MDSPLESIIFVLALGIFCYFSYFVSPLYQAQGDYSTVISEGLSREKYEYAFGIALIGASIPGLIAPFYKKRKMLKPAATILFLVYLFLTTARLIIVGPIPLVWVSNLLLAIVAGIISLHQGVRKE